jgi:hypothetical protein
VLNAVLQRDCALKVAIAFSIDTVGEVRGRSGVDIPDELEPVFVSSLIAR